MASTYGVEETWFQLDAAFTDAVDGQDLDLVVKLADPDHADLTWTASDDGDLVATTEKGAEVHRLDTDDIAVAGTGAFKVTGDSAAAGSGFLRISGRLKHRGGGTAGASACNEFRLTPGGGGSHGTSSCMEVGKVSGTGTTGTIHGATACMPVR